MNRCKVRVGFVSSLAYGLIPRALETLRTAAPGIEVEMFEQSSAAQCQGVREHRLDLGLVFLPVEAQELKMRFLFREPLVTLLPAKHALAAARSVALERLHQEPFYHVLAPTAGGLSGNSARALPGEWL